jgi:hypothetical protein
MVPFIAHISQITKPWPRPQSGSHQGRLKPQITMSAGLFGGNEQNQFIFGICLLFGIYYLVLFKHHEIALLINILPKLVPVCF